MSTDETCVFCEIIAGRAPADIVGDWNEAMAIVPLNPVTAGHVIVIPKRHVEDATTSPLITGKTALIAANVGMRTGGAFNLITSVGAPATQTVMHLHWHVVPRAEGDGLHLPWTELSDDAQQAEADAAERRAWTGQQRAAVGAHGIPQELIDILDQRAGKIHSADGPVIGALAEILTRHAELLADTTRFKVDEAIIGARIDEMAPEGGWWHSTTPEALEAVLSDLVGRGMLLDAAVEAIERVMAATRDEYGE